MGSIKIKVDKTIQLDMQVKATIKNEDDIDDLLDEIRERIDSSFGSFENDDFDEDISAAPIIIHESRIPFKTPDPKFITTDNGTLCKLGNDGKYHEVMDDEDFREYESGEW